MSALNIIKNRRTQYALGKNIELSQTEIEALVREAVREAPSAFNSQSSRVVILFNEEHQKLWDLVKDTLRPLVTADQFPATDRRRARQGRHLLLRDPRRPRARHFDDTGPLRYRGACGDTLCHAAPAAVRGYLYLQGLAGPI